MNLEINYHSITINDSKIYLPYDRLEFKNDKCMCGKHDVPQLIVYLDKRQTSVITLESMENFKKLQSEYNEFLEENTQKMKVKKTNHSELMNKFPKLTFSEDDGAILFYKLPNGEKANYGDTIVKDKNDKYRLITQTQHHEKKCYKAGDTIISPDIILIQREGTSGFALFDDRRKVQITDYRNTPFAISKDGEKIIEKKYVEKLKQKTQ